MSSAGEWESVLRQGIRAQQSSVAFGKAGALLGGSEGAWVLLFNAAQKDEGVYTLQGNKPDVGRRTYLVGFSEKDDAESFVSLLEAETFDPASVSRWSSLQLQAFCETANFDLALVPCGWLLLPPSQNVYDRQASERSS